MSGTNKTLMRLTKRVNLLLDRRIFIKIERAVLEKRWA
jgi:hypothetical protein